MGMDSTMILVSECKDKIEALCNYFNGLGNLDATYEEDEENELTRLMIYEHSELIDVGKYYAVKYDLRKALECEIYERIKQDNREDKLQGVVMLYYNDYNDEIFATRDGDDNNSVAIGDHVYEEIYIDHDYSDIPLEAIFKELLDWKSPVVIKH